jgi:hypothetical protein
MYRSLAADEIVGTCRMMQERIAERFPGSGLSKVAAEIQATSEQAAALSDWLSKPQVALRLLAGLGVFCLVAVVAAGLLSLKLQPTFSSVAEFLQGSEAAINEVVFLGIAVVFFLTLENRLKRRQALKAIHVLRSMAHIIDMHQLTKDPEQVTGPMPPGAPGGKRPLSPADLIRYLDYCSDLLALLSKIAALYVQQFNDPVTLAAVNEVENLTNGLARKIWQKVMILDRIIAPAPAAHPPAAK